MNPQRRADPEPPARRATETAFATELATVRPSLLGAYFSRLPEARAAVLGRLWRALLYEPLPDVVARDGSSGSVGLRDGRVLLGPARLPHDLAAPWDPPVVRMGGRAYLHPAELLEALALPGARGLTTELDHSVASLALSLAGAAAVEARGPAAGTDSSVQFEQSVVDGHPYHPCCRSRPGLSVAEQLAYAPEHRPVVGLDLVAVPAARCRVSGNWPIRLRDGDRLLLPVHPWQSRHVLPGVGYRTLATAAIPARPLISVRTLAPVAGGADLKTSLTTRMTSQIRDISGQSVQNSAPLSTLLSDLVQRLEGGLLITRNVAAATAVIQDAPSADLAVLLRESPARAAGARAGERVLPVAALCARPASGGPPQILSLLASADEGPTVTDWLAAFARLLLPAALRLLAWGVALEAHGQNVLVVLDSDARPLRVVYRDLADVRVSPARLARGGFPVPPLSRRVLEDDPAQLRRHLFGSLIGGTFSSLVSALAEGERATETRLWGVVAATARNQIERARDTRDGRADLDALFDEQLSVKALTLMRLEGAHRTNTWAGVPNPLV